MPIHTTIHTRYIMAYQYKIGLAHWFSPRVKVLAAMMYCGKVGFRSSVNNHDYSGTASQVTPQVGFELTINGLQFYVIAN